MMKLMFYRGPGNIVTKIIRAYTRGPYSHVELQFTNGTRFFTSGHGVFQGAHMVRDHRMYGPLWDAILIPTTQEQEDAAQRFAFALIGIPFDLRGLFRFLVPGRSRRKGKYCSAVILDVLQKSLRMFLEVKSKISPNGLHRLFLSHKHTLISDSVPKDSLTLGACPEYRSPAFGDPGSSGTPVSLSNPEKGSDGRSACRSETWFR
jgi:hypothetical protein